MLSGGGWGADFASGGGGEQVPVGGGIVFAYGDGGVKDLLMVVMGGGAMVHSLEARGGMLNTSYFIVK